MKFSFSGIKYYYYYHTGFTLVELLVVMGVIGTLAAGLVMVMNPSGQLAKARDAERKSDLIQLQRALEVYYDDYDKYPDELIQLKDASAAYIEQIPVDPSHNDVPYLYVPLSPANQMYRIYTHLESPNDPHACNPADNADNCPNAPENSCGLNANESCNFGVSSPNTSP